MIFVLDLGNTRIKWGVALDGALVSSGVLELADGVDNALPPCLCPERVAAVSVGGPEQRLQVEQLVQRWWGLPVSWLVASAGCCGVTSRYRPPEQLGADRWAALIGAADRADGWAQVVVSAGTAVTIDALSADGVFLGGMILPGYTLMKRALAGNTAQLPWAEGRWHDFPRSTDDSIETGVLTAIRAAVMEMRERLALRGDEVATLVCGGDAERLSALLDAPCETRPALVLEGVARWASELKEDQ
ncbi:type III pantothenate kinase [Chitinibacteraceae bacterium HSL-7]